MEQAVFFDSTLEARVPESNRKQIIAEVREAREVSRVLLLRQACGIWKDHDDLPDLHELRAEFDRNCCWLR